MSEEENTKAQTPLDDEQDILTPITQSEAWRKLQSDLGEKTYYKIEKTYHYLAIVKHTPVGNYLYCPYGPVAVNSESFAVALNDLRLLALKNHAIFFRIEPQNPKFVDLLPASARKSRDLNPKDTWVLDLTQDRATIITNFSQGTRTRFNTYAKKGLIVEVTKDPAAINYLVELQNKLFKTKNLNTFSARYLRIELKQSFANLYLVKYHRPAELPPDKDLPADGQVLAASLFFDHAGTRYYMQSAADIAYKKLPATVALLTQAIFDAKDQGIKHFDFWGIAPDDAPADHPWKGFTEFKKSFGGAPHHYGGTYDIVLNRTKYRLYQSTRRLHRFLRKI